MKKMFIFFLALIVSFVLMDIMLFGSANAASDCVYTHPDPTKGRYGTHGSLVIRRDNNEIDRTGLCWNGKILCSSGWSGLSCAEHYSPGTIKSHWKMKGESPITTGSGGRIIYWCKKDSTWDTVWQNEICAPTTTTHKFRRDNAGCYQWRFCTPSSLLTCSDYLGKCGSALSDNNGGKIDCSGNCDSGQYCNSGACTNAPTKLMVRKGGKTYAVDLVEIMKSGVPNPEASKVRIQTGAGIKALRKMP